MSTDSTPEEILAAVDAEKKAILAARAQRDKTLTSYSRLRKLFRKVPLFSPGKVSPKSPGPVELPGKGRRMLELGWPKDRRELANVVRELHRALADVGLAGRIERLAGGSPEGDYALSILCSESAADMKKRLAELNNPLRYDFACSVRDWLRGLEDRILDPETLRGKFGVWEVTEEWASQVEAEQAGQTTGAPSTLKSEHWTILEALNRSPHETMVQVDIAEAAQLSARTVGDRLRELRQWGLTQRPQGERGGDALTAEGKSRLDARAKAIPAD
jgi:hypothetical protein